MRPGDPPHAPDEPSDYLADLLAHSKAMVEALEASPHTCSACGEKKLRPEDACPRCDQAADERRRAAGELREKLQAFWNSTGPRYHWCSFDAPELPGRVKDASAIAKARAAAAEGIDRVVFVGGAGLGKTVLACSLARELLKLHLFNQAAFVEALELARARSQAGLGHEAPSVDTARRAKVLILDDLGADRPSPTSAIPDVLHERHRHMRPTIITTAFDVDAIAARYGDGVARRVFEHAVVIELRGRR